MKPAKSRILGGISGFYTLENVWFHDGSYRMSDGWDKAEHTDMYGEGFPESQKIMSGPGLVIHDSLSSSEKPDVCFSGTTGMSSILF